jgi:peroxiredoxin
MDDVLADSFPASDPPSWTPGMARPAPATVHVGQEVGRRLQTGDLVPHFTVTTFRGENFDYSDIWQRKNLVLVVLPHAESAATTKLVDQFAARMPELTDDDSACVITRNSVSGIPSPGIVVADRWGEIHHVAEGNTVDDLPSPDDLIGWLRSVQHQCPECEGEAK